MSKVPLHFSKMHSLGNDFMVVDVAGGPMAGWFAEAPDLSIMQHWANRHTGVGFDQLLLLNNDTTAATVQMRIFNTDGSEVQQCGNGVRCAAKFIHATHSVNDNFVLIKVGDHIMEAEILSDGRVCVDMGVPEFDPPRIPFICDEQALSYMIDLPQQSLQVGVVSMGNPHAVVQLDSEQALALCPVSEIGMSLQTDSRFPQGVNVEFVQRVDAKRINLRVYERGVGETLACGSGACAAVAVGQSRALLEDKVDVHLQCGVLEVETKAKHLFLTGPVSWTYNGVIEL